jgi:hypothetical protein
MCISTWLFSTAYDGSTGVCRVLNGDHRGHGVAFAMRDLGSQAGIRLRAYVTFDAGARPSANFHDATSVIEVTDRQELAQWNHHRWHFASVVVRAFDGNDSILGEASEPGHRFGLTGAGELVNPLDDAEALTRVGAAALKAAGCTTAATVAA